MKSLPDIHDQKILLSIVVSVYNTSAQLRNTLESIHQQRGNIEVLCIDDCSTDDSLELIKEYIGIDGRFALVKHDANQGIHSTRIEGLKETTGKYVWLVDGDDTLPMGVCEQLLRVIKQTCVDIIHFNAKIIRENSVPD